MTAVVEEYKGLKAETDADLLAMQVGDFYEFFDSDAETVADELDLKVSTKSSQGGSYPMAGVPVDDLTPYLVQLIERGYRVAVADQQEEGEGHDRSITRVVTPGTLLETSDAAARYLAAAVREGETVGLAFAEVTTGQFAVTEVATDEEFSELYRFEPREVLPGPDLRADDDWLSTARERGDASLTVHEAEAFAPGATDRAVREQFGEGAAESLGLESGSPAVRAAGAVLDYVASTGSGVLGALSRLQPYRTDDVVALDATTQRNLELTETMRGDSEGTLLATVDHTATAAGTRLLREWLARPRQSLPELERRQAGVAALADAALAREEVRDLLGEAADVERLASKATSGTADARDLRRAAETLALFADVRAAVERAPDLAESPVADVLDRPDADRVAALADDVLDALIAEPPSTTTEGGLFERGHDPELDELIERHEELESWFDDLADREKRRLGVTHLQVDRNRTDGYYLQVGKSETDQVPAEYREIKTLKNSKRYETDDLLEKERELLRVEERRAEYETALFESLRERVADAADLLQAVGRALAEIDVLAGFAVHAVENDWTRPTLTEGDEFTVEGGRHPVVEQTTAFVPNDADLHDDRRFLVVTGPNMSGKSTYMRQVALIALLAQVGCFVPADRATVGLVDGIYTRVGALDELAQGRSTFMVEMQELANILHAATEESLVILDEVGRGTATFDGISIAWAATEYLHNEVRAKTLFATHYHELTALADHLADVANVHVAAEERDGEVTFLRTVREGAGDRSYGVHVADLAGVPEPVVSRADEVLGRLREEKAIEARGSGSGETVQAVFDLGSGEFRGGASADGGETGGESDPLDPATASVLEELRGTDVNETPPVELLARVQEWQRRLEE